MEAVISVFIVFKVCYRDNSFLRTFRMNVFAHTYTFYTNIYVT